MKRLPAILLLCALWVLPDAIQAQRKEVHRLSFQDTIQLGGQTCVLSIGNCSGDGEYCRELGIARISPGPRKWLKTILLDFCMPDCNSVQYQIGNYVVGENTVTLYTAFTFEGQISMAPVGVRKQVYQLASSGEFKMVSAVAAMVEHGPCPDLASWKEIAKTRNPNDNGAEAWRLFCECYEEEFQAKPVGGKEAVLLRKEVLQILGPRMEDLYKNASYPIVRI